MSDDNVHLHVLLVEDDKENLELFMKTLPETLSGCHLHYDPCGDIDHVSERLEWQRYDLILTDIYKDRGEHSANLKSDAKAGDIVKAIRERRFCPIVAFTDGSFPESLKDQASPFLKLAGKSSGNDEIEKAMKELLATGIPQAARKLHDELDESAGPRFLWSFLEDNWQNLEEKGLNSAGILERLIRRRASVQLGRLDPSGEGVTEVQNVVPGDYYIMPPLSETYRLGHILRAKDDQSLSVLLTPHCYLQVQPKAQTPRADHVLLIRAVSCKGIWDRDLAKDPRRPSEPKRQEMLRKVIQSPAQIGKPEGRYWFLPGFLEIQDSYCDFLQVQSVQHDTLDSEYEALAVLDTPFAEAFQACFTSFYSSVGLPSLEVQHLMHLISEGVPGDD